MILFIMYIKEDSKCLYETNKSRKSRPNINDEQCPYHVEELLVQSQKKAKGRSRQRLLPIIESPSTLWTVVNGQVKAWSSSVKGECVGRRATAQ